MKKEEYINKIKKATQDELLIIRMDNQFKLDRDIKEAIMDRFQTLECLKLKKRR